MQFQDQYEVARVNYARLRLMGSFSIHNFILIYIGPSESWLILLDSALRYNKWAEDFSLLDDFYDET